LRGDQLFWNNGLLDVKIVKIKDYEVDTSSGISMRINGRSLKE